MSIPVLVEPTFTLQHILSVEASTRGRDSMQSLSAAVIPLDTTAENPPRKFTPTSLAVSSRVLATLR